MTHDALMVLAAGFTLGITFMAGHLLGYERGRRDEARRHRNARERIRTW